MTRGDILVGLFQFVSMNSSNVALKYVSFPFVVLAKSAKVIPVILIGACRGVYKPDFKQYCIAFFISIGLFIFNFYKVSGNILLLRTLLLLARPTFAPHIIQI